MSTQASMALSGAAVMWWLAAAWWLASDRSPVVTIAALGIGILGTAVAIRGMRQPESRTRDAVAALVAALVGVVLAFAFSG